MKPSKAIQQDRNDTQYFHIIPTSFAIFIKLDAHTHYSLLATCHISLITDNKWL